jgi:hypothetical protein
MEAIAFNAQPINTRLVARVYAWIAQMGHTQ